MAGRPGEVRRRAGLRGQQVVPQRPGRATVHGTVARPAPPPDDRRQPPARERTPMPDFRIGEADFLLDGEPVRILSGALHYFRVHPDSWADRIEKARLMGLNTIETYVAWNAHAPAPDVF